MFQKITVLLKNHFGLRAKSALLHIGFSDDHDLSEKKLTLGNLKQISEKMLVDLNKMRDSKNIHILYQTIQRLKKISMQEVDVKVWPQLRRFQAELWFRVLDIIEKEINRNCDINKQPSINISPPGPYPSGIAPEAIKEPELRKEYEKAIEENSRKIKEHKYQSMLRQMEVEFPKKLKTLLIWFYARDPDAIEELKRLFEKYKTNKKLSVEILKVVKEERIRNKSKEDLHLRKDAVKEMERQAQKELRLVKEIAKAEREKMDIEMQLKRMRAEMMIEYSWIFQNYMIGTEGLPHNRLWYAKKLFEHDEISTGMQLKELKRILGKPDKLEEKEDRIIYIYIIPDYGEIRLILSDGKLVKIEEYEKEANKIIEWNKKISNP